MVHTLHSKHDDEDSPSHAQSSVVAESHVQKPPPSLVHADTIGEDEADRLKDIATDVRDQNDIERDIGRQADRLLTEQANERDQRRLDKTNVERERLQGQVRKLRDRLNRPTGSATSLRLQAEISHLEAQMKTLDTDLKQIQERIDQRAGEEAQVGERNNVETGNRRMAGESQRDFLIRTGKITPFSKIPGRTLSRSDSTLQGMLLDAEEAESVHEEEALADESGTTAVLSHRNLTQPGFSNLGNSEEESAEDFESHRPRKRRLLQQKKSLPYPRTRTIHKGSSPSGMATEGVDISSDGSDCKDIYMPELDNQDYTSVDDSGKSSDDMKDIPASEMSPRRRKARKRKTRIPRESLKEDLTGLDDGNERLFQRRLDIWIERRKAARDKAITREKEGRTQNGSFVRKDATGEQADNKHRKEEEWHMQHPVRPDAVFEGGLSVPGDIYPSLFDYQKTGVQWLWELYSQQVGGIVGDEMGLGKTIQIIAFLAGLHYSKKITKPVIVVAPATVMKQWVNEFHTWWPPFRVSILHASGSGMIDVGREAQYEDEMLSALPNTSGRKPLTKAQKSAKKIVDRVVKDGHILVTTYSGLQSYAELLIPIEWEYAVLDEGHKIRNPNTGITIYCKELRTANRIILSGTPMQNNLVELWSLFDFVFPMRLGTLVNFRNQFEFPIRQGGYANASNLQVQTAMKCAETLKDTISPYLLQRFKADVASDLPKKSEQVLFCKLTKIQRDVYEQFLGSDDLKAIMNGKRQVLYGVDILRKICNHPDLQDHKVLSKKSSYQYGSGAKSGKMQVVKALLELWREQGHKTLLFAQHRIMLDILERFIRSLGGFDYRRMDGTTPIHTRQGLVDEFNNNPDAHVFLLTTKVGGLGVNLTGADRVIIYDPDWNPSTDVQARERAWRLGQKREVMIYRLMTVGTIEEKIYHRQLFKQFLINKILRDPKQRQTFQMKDLHDLFTLGSANGSATETSQLFKGTEVRFEEQNDTDEPPPTNGIRSTESSADKVNGKDSDSSVRNLIGVASLERFYGEKVEEREAASRNGNNSEARVMEGIFARSGVQAALEHDQILDGKKRVSADPGMIEAEARRMAAEAAEELKKASDGARNVPVGTPTWTGQYGSAGRPEHQQRRLGRGRGGPPSSSILAGLQSRQTANGPISGSRSSTPGSTASGPRGTDFMKMIRDYLVAHGGFVHTQMLIDQFNRYCSTPAKTAEFKAMLTEIARLEKSSRGRGRWVLKEEYQSRT
ncbi:hypothetical protein MMC21_005494 [Puttea exsequens]|nr:hypothetical protein [Puttea exsequens]